MNKIQTICVNCTHCYIDRRNLGKKDDPHWYNYYCQAITRPMCIDPVSGEKVYYTEHGDNVHYGDDKHPHCKNINTHGNCSLFQRKLFGAFRWK